MKYFLFNKARDFKGASMENCVYEDGALRIQNPKDNARGRFLSGLLDSREAGTCWHRMKMMARDMGDASIQFFFYTSETRNVPGLLQTADLGQYLDDPGISIEEKKERLRSFLAKTALNPEDILLHDLKGRYFWFIADLYGQGEESPNICCLQLFFPAESWTRWLPEIYREEGTNSFLERYLGIFQSIYEDTERRIRESGRLLDPRVTPPEILKWLAGWIDVEGIHMWPEERLRIFMEQAVDLYRIRGTREGLLRLVRLYTGREAFLVEYHQLLPYLNQEEQREKLTALYGTDRSACFLLIPDEAVRTPEEYRALQCIVEDGRPAQISVRIVALKPFFILGGHSYLGINSRLENLRPMALGGNALLPFAALLGKE